MIIADTTKGRVHITEEYIQGKKLFNVSYKLKGDELWSNADIHSSIQDAIKQKESIARQINNDQFYITMKYLSDYIEDKQTAAFNKAGAFFAFGRKQMDEQKQEGIKYYNMGAGMLCPKDTADELMESLSKIHAEGMKQDIKDNTKEGVIKRELANHEAYYTGDIESTVDALELYDITTEEIYNVFKVQNALEANHSF